MTFYHGYLIATGQTTREQLKRQIPSYDDDTTSGSNVRRHASPYSEGVIKNCTAALCLPIAGRREHDSNLIIRNQYNVVM
jgi:hypothetical protein